PRLELPLPAGRQVAGELRPFGEAASRRLTAGAEPIGEMQNRPGTEGDVDERIEVEDPFALGLGEAAADGDHALGIGILERLRLSQMRGEALIGLLANRAGVEDDHVRLLL